MDEWTLENELDFSFVERLLMSIYDVFAVFGLTLECVVESWILSSCGEAISCERGRLVSEDVYVGSCRVAASQILRRSSHESSSSSLGEAKMLSVDAKSCNSVDC